MKKGEMAPEIDLAAGLEESLGRLGGRFKIEMVNLDWLEQHNLQEIEADFGKECLDERPLAPFNSIPRTSLKFPGASLGEAVLEAMETRRPVNQILHQRLGTGQSVFLHDDIHHEREWQAGGNVSGCGANDNLSAITARFLTLAEGLTDNDAIELARQLVGSQTGGDRIRELVKAGAKIVATYAGSHTGRRLVVNTLKGKTLDHLAPDGERNFVVDAWSAGNPEKMAKLALATVDVLLPPELQQIELAII